MVPKPKRQQGMALVMVMVIMAVGTMLALSSFVMSQTSERLAGNYRSVVLAYNEAERGVALFYDDSMPWPFPSHEALLPELASRTQAYRNQIRDELPVLLGCDDDEDGERLGDEWVEALLEAPGVMDWMAGLFPEPVADNPESNAEASYQVLLQPLMPAVISEIAQAAGGCDGGGIAAAEEVLRNDVSFLLVSTGLHGAAGQQSERTVEALFHWNATSSAGRQVVGIDTCQGVQVQGSGIIDSYDSSLGPYGEGNRHGTLATITSQVAQAPDDSRFDPSSRDYQARDASVYLQGSSPIYGDVLSPGGVALVGSSAIHGQVQSNASVNVAGGGVSIFGDVSAGGRAWFGSSGTVHGNVSAQQSLEFNNWSAGVTGDATAPAVNTSSRHNSNRDPADQVGGTLRYARPSFEEVPFVSSAADCDTYGFGDARSDPVMQVTEQGVSVSSRLNMGGGNSDYRMTAAGVEVLNERTGLWERIGVAPREVKVLERETLAVGFAGFTFGGSNRLVVGSPGAPVDMTLYLDGDTSIGGGGSITVSEGSTLTIVTTGQFDLASGIVVGDGKPSRVVDDEVMPILSLYSSHEQTGNQAGVSIRGASAFHGQVVAPFSTVDIGGSGGFYGAASADKILVSGSGGFHFDEQLLELNHGGGQGAAGLEPGLLVGHWR